MERKEAIEIVRKLYNESLFLKKDKEAMVTLIPELKENEDERIRKEILEYFQQFENEELRGVNISDWIAWLEKQGEKVKPIESFNSEFERQISQLIASIINKEHEYTEAFIKWTSNALLNYAKHEIEKQVEQKPVEDVEQVDNLHQYLYGNDDIEPKFKIGDYIERKDGLGYHAKIIFIGKNLYGCEKLIYSEDSSPFFELMFKNQDEFKISSDFQQKPVEWSKKDSPYYDDICEILINLLHSESPNVNKSAIQKDLDWFITFVNQAKK